MELKLESSFAGVCRGSEGCYLYPVFSSMRSFTYSSVCSPICSLVYSSGHSFVCSFVCSSLGEGKSISVGASYEKDRRREGEENRGSVILCEGNLGGALISSPSETSVSFVWGAFLSNLDSVLEEEFCFESCFKSCFEKCRALSVRGAGLLVKDSEEENIAFGAFGIPGDPGCDSNSLSNTFCHFPILPIMRVNNAEVFGESEGDSVWEFWKGIAPRFVFWREEANLILISSCTALPYSSKLRYNIGERVSEFSTLRDSLRAPYKLEGN